MSNQNRNPNPSRPPDISPSEWHKHVQTATDCIRLAGFCESVPTHAIDHMRDVLLGLVADKRLAAVLVELKLLRAAHDAGAILSRRIVDITANVTPEREVQRARHFDEIIDNAIAIIEGRKP